MRSVRASADEKYDTEMYIKCVSGVLNYERCGMLVDLLMHQVRRMVAP
jgi:hypothetical protein